MADDLEPNKKPDVQSEELGPPPGSIPDQYPNKWEGVPGITPSYKETRTEKTITEYDENGNPVYTETQRDYIYNSPVISPDGKLKGYLDGLEGHKNIQRHLEAPREHNISFQSDFSSLAHRADFQSLVDTYNGFGSGYSLGTIAAMVDRWTAAGNHYTGSLTECTAPAGSPSTTQQDYSSSVGALDDSTGSGMGSGMGADPNDTGGDGYGGGYDGGYGGVAGGDNIGDSGGDHASNDGGGYGGGPGPSGGGAGGAGYGGEDRDTSNLSASGGNYGTNGPDTTESSSGSGSSSSESSSGSSSGSSGNSSGSGGGVGGGAGSASEGSGSYAPVVLDLDGDGVELVSASAGAQYDTNDDGMRERLGWAGKDDGLLAIDLDGDGKITGAKELSFAMHTAEQGDTDLQGLAKVFDSNKDGVLDANDKAFDKFRIWQDKDGDGISDKGEVKTLSEMGIKSIGVVSDGKAYKDAGNTVHGTASYTKLDGTTRAVGDVDFKIAA